MRLSEAIREGSKDAVQINGHFWDGGNGYCAMGMAMRALGIKIGLTDKAANASFDELMNMFPMLESDAENTANRTIGSFIWDANDNRGLSPSQIADAVEVFENRISNARLLKTPAQENVAVLQPA